MPPRYLERLQRQTQVYRKVFGETGFDPPRYPSSISGSSISGSSLRSSTQAPPAYYEVNHAHGVGFDKPALPTNSLVLVIGASGWQGLHVSKQLLEHGYRVRGTVRNADKAAWVNKYFRGLYGIGRFTPAVIPDMTLHGALDSAVRGCAGVVHCASVNSFASDPAQVIVPSIAGALNALEAAAKEPNIRRFVYCSSTAAASSPAPDRCIEVTSHSWNMSAFGMAWDLPPYNSRRAGAVYDSSKLQSEQCIWKWYHDHKPGFELNAVLPGMTWGRILDSQHPERPKHIQILKEMFDGQDAAITVVPPRMSHLDPHLLSVTVSQSDIAHVSIAFFVDIQDAALLHVAALILPDIRDQRIFAAHTAYNVNSILKLLRELYPTRHFGEDIDDCSIDMSKYTEIGRSEELLRRMGKDGWTDLETSVAASCESFF